jgi:hypothetical protein
VERPLDAASLSRQRTKTVLLCLLYIPSAAIPWIAIPWVGYRIIVKGDGSLFSILMAVAAGGLMALPFIFILPQLPALLMLLADELLGKKDDPP